jgi:protease II
VCYWLWQCRWRRHDAKRIPSGARLQAATCSGTPVLLRVDFDAGHGIGSTRAQQDREALDRYAFLIWQTSRSIR